MRLLVHGGRSVAWGYTAHVVKDESEYTERHRKRYYKYTSGSIKWAKQEHSRQADSSAQQGCLAYRSAAMDLTDDF